MLHHLQAIPGMLGVYEIWQLPFTLAMMVLAAAITARPVKAFEKVEAFLARIGERPILSILVICALVIVPRLALWPLIGAQDPVIGDEYSLILQAKTFLSGRLAVPASLPPNFEALYVLLAPTYSSIYPVLRSFPLLLGYLLGVGASGGVLLSMAALAVAVYWMVRVWMDARYGLVAALIVILRFGLFSMWVNSYWGGAFTALGGILILGAYKLLETRPTALAGAAFGLGAVILMTTRPYEGLFFAAPITLALVVYLIRAHPDVRRSLAIPGALAAALVVAGLGLSLAHNRAVTRDWKAPPYVEYQRTTGYAPALWLQKPVANPPTPPRYQNFGSDIALAQQMRTIGGFQSFEEFRFLSYWGFYIGFALSIPFFLGVWALRREPAILASAASLAVALVLVTWNWAHYAAPGFGVVILCVMLGFRRLRVWRPSGAAFGLSLSRTLPLALLLGAALPISSAIFGAPAFPMWTSGMHNAPCCWIHSRSIHVATENEVDRSNGRNLVIADTGPKAPPEEILIANEPDIDNARTIWVNHDPEFDAATIEHYPDRRIWRLSWLDDRSPCLQLFKAPPRQVSANLFGDMAPLPGDPDRGWFPASEGKCPGGLTRAPWTISSKR